MVKPFVPDEKNVTDLVEKLVSNRLYSSDEYRTTKMASAIMLSHLYGPLENRLFEIGDWGGVFGLVNIIRGWKADLFFKIWDKDLWGPTLRREISDAIDVAIDEFCLERIFLETPDEHTAKLAMNYGFKQEGLLRNQFRWDGEHYDVLCLGLNRRY